MNDISSERPASQATCHSAPKLKKPYWFAPDGLPGTDFNRAIVEPGTNETFPQGAVAIYVDDDFWSVAALPLEEYRDVPIEAIVPQYWPNYIDQATYCPDHGTMEQRVYFAESAAEAERARCDATFEQYRTLLAEVERLRRGRTDISPRRPSRVELTVNYCVRQYEHLLTAMAHEASPRPEMKGVCATCGLLVSDRVHSSHWRKKHDAGFSHSMDNALWAEDTSLIDDPLAQVDERRQAETACGLRSAGPPARSALADAP